MQGYWELDVIKEKANCISPYHCEMAMVIKPLNLDLANYPITYVCNSWKKGGNQSYAVHISPYNLSSIGGSHI